MPNKPGPKPTRPRARKLKPPTRKRCANCPKFFVPKKKTQRFHDAACKDQFHNNRSGFGKLREKLPLFIKAEVALVLCELEARIEALESANVERSKIDAGANSGEAKTTIGHVFEIGGSKCLYCGCSRASAYKSTCV
jgi:hypothetical protein